ncbi:MAG: redoxin domain-containing protein [Bacteroidaceae bacterium]|nr:redoxin domain-containing protein [Bacteroidaceae bacterium]
MHYALSIKHYTIAIFTLLALMSCGGKKGELRIKGEIKGLNNAALTVFSRDGVIQGIDTLHVRQSKIDWSCPCTKEHGTLTIVYPTFSTLTVFGGSGDVIKIEGDAKQLSATKVSGNEANKAYTALRAQLENATSEATDSLIKAFINTNPNSPVTRFLQLDELSKQTPEALRKGTKLPDFTIVTRQGDTITTDSLKGKHTLMAFWANWRGGTTALNTRIRKLRRQAKKDLKCISYNIDLNTNILDYVERTDTITWHSCHAPTLFQSELPSRLGIRDIPYFILTDTATRIICTGSDWQKDIEPALTEITSPKEEQAK